uniref:MFS domain-containing protein n=1 Tax=Gongylonema pulchrum TaxID=637853 RepID=A0A183DXS1_9BILA
LAFLVTYGIMFGFGQGIAYVLTWAPEHVGLVSGIVAAGFGVSSSIFAPLQTIYINPSSYKPTAFGQAVGLVVICNPPNPEEQSEALQAQISTSVWPWCERVVGTERASLLCNSNRYRYTKLQLFVEEVVYND